MSNSLLPRVPGRRLFDFDADGRPLSEQIRRLRRQVPLTTLLLVTAYQFGQRLLSGLDPEAVFLAASVFNGLLAALMVWLGVSWLGREVARREAVTGLNVRLTFLLGAARRLIEAPDEEAVARLALQLPGELTSVVSAAALVRFDDHRQPRPVEFRGALDETVLLDWHRSLLAQSLRLECAACQAHTAHRGEACSVFQRLPLTDVNRMVCFPLQRQTRQFAVLGLFLRQGLELTAAEQEVLQALVAHIGLAFENVRLRAHELTTLFDLHETRHLRRDREGWMQRVLQHTVEAGRAEAGLLLLPGADGQLEPGAAAGEWLGAGRQPLLESLAAGVINQAETEPVVASLQTADPNTTTVLCAPMRADADAVGVIVLGSPRPEAFLPAHVRLVAAIATQAALLADNARLYSQVERQAVLAERGRLAREMHDGLAQTLGYLKMRANQIAGWLESGQSDRAADGLRELAQAANSAYLDLRGALDGLRAPLSREPGSALGADLRRLGGEFEERSGISVEVEVDDEIELGPIAQAHLRSIVQESLANAHKHARARRVCLRLVRAEDRIVLQIEDDGQGFDAARDWPAQHHGLRVMQERAALLGAELQLTTALGAGTRVQLDWPGAPLGARQ